MTLAKNPIPGLVLRLGLPICTGFHWYDLSYGQAFLSLLLASFDVVDARTRSWQESHEIWIDRNAQHLSKIRRFTMWFPAWLLKRPQTIADFEPAYGKRPHYFIRLDFLVVVGRYRYR